MIKELLNLAVLISLDLIWWHAADVRLRGRSHHRLWRILLCLFMFAQMTYVLWFLARTLFEGVPELWPPAGAVAAYIWHLLVLPVACLFILGAWLVARWRIRGSRNLVAARAPASAKDNQSKLSRREVLSAAATTLPPLATVAITGGGLAHTGMFRVRRVELSIPQLPPDLDGMTIAHVTDLHIGRFMPPELTGPVADEVNALSCDLIAFTGDLMDVSMPNPAAGIDFLRRLHPRHGLVVIEGNHDVMFKAERFEAEIKSAGLPLLLDEAMTIRVAGRATPVQLLGMSWGELLRGSQLHKHGRARNSFFREPSDEARAASIRRLISLREPGAFPILLAHHPHAFDPAAQAGLPLVLSGHTHGGQLMLTPNIGAGPLRFRYWSGLYRKPNSQLFISNGVGSWFPLRVNAPAEIVHLTLRHEPGLPANG